MRKFELGLDFAKQMDAADPLKDVRKRFYIKEGEIYMDGNSLGLCSQDAEAALFKMLEVWKKEGIEIWSVENGKYFMYQYHLGELAAHLINADPSEVTIGNSTTVNIHQAIATFYKPTAEKYKILVDDLNFASDRYAVDSQVLLKELDVKDAVKVVPSRDGRTISEDDVIAAMTDDVAIVMLPAVLYRSAQLVDMERVTAEAHKRGIIVGWDLCHSIGAVPHDFKKIDPDFAVFCTYKYLSGGPGSIAGLFISKKHFGMTPGLAGWQGNKKDTQFKLLHQFEHAQDAGGWQIGTQSLFSMAPLEGALNLYKEVGMQKIRAKSLDITAYLMFLADSRLAKHGYSVGTPREDAVRGGHVALEHDDAYRICLALKKHKIVPDFREPNVVRLAPVALYVSYEEVHKLVDTLESIAVNKEYENFDTKRAIVV